MLTKHLRPLLVLLLRERFRAALAKAPNRDEVTLKGLFHGVRLDGARYTVDVVLRREE